jgi:intein/homing endonuclease
VNGKQVTIGEYYDSLDDVFLTFDDENREYVKKVIETHKTKSFDERTECVVDNNIEYVKKHYVNKRMFRITAEDGKEIILTENHGIIVYRDGEYKTVKPSECLPDDLLISIDVT